MVEHLAKFVLSAIFVYAGAVKIADPEGMLKAIHGYQLVGGWWALVGAYLIPWLEVWAGVGLWIRPLRRGAALILLGLLTLFLIAIVSAWARGIPASCGCFGEPEGVDSYWQLITRDVALWIVAAYVGTRDWKLEIRN